MTIERKITIGLEDIQSVVFECTGCLSRLSVSPEKQMGAIPQRCPYCQQEWFLDTKQLQGHVVSPFVNFTTSVGQLRALAKQGATSGQSVGFRILLEFDGTKL
jgi:hypothetical protein